MLHVVYELDYHNYDRYRTHLLSLDPDSRYLRFGHKISDDGVNELCERFKDNFQRHRVFVIENNDLEVLGVGHISLEGRSVELAFSVLKQYQGQGMGSSLMARVVEWCQNRGIKTGCMVCLKRNAAVKRLAGKHGILITEGGEVMADVDIPELTAISLIHEAAVDGIAKIDHLGKLQRKFAQMFTLPLRFK
jgi:GNAT superfamily N-acetyltransferase